MHCLIIFCFVSSSNYHLLVKKSSTNILMGYAIHDNLFGVSMEYTKKIFVWIIKKYISYELSVYYLCYVWRSIYSVLFKKPLVHFISPKWHSLQSINCFKTSTNICSEKNPTFQIKYQFILHFFLYI